MATASQVIAKARTQIGVHEVGYSNKVKYNDWLWGKGKYGTWAAWCAVFVNWVFAQVGGANLVPKTAGVSVMFSNFGSKGAKKISKYSLKPGDVVRFTFSHVGIATSKPKNGRIRVIAGNTSSGAGGSQRDGGGVHEKWVPLSTIQYGYRPKYKAVPLKRMSTKNPLKVNGIFGPRTKAFLRVALGLSPVAAFGPVTKKALQKKLHVTVDGEVGPKTVKALQKKVGSKADGEWGKNTTKALQKWLNKRKKF